MYACVFIYFKTQSSGPLSGRTFSHISVSLCLSDRKWLISDWMVAPVTRFVWFMRLALIFLSLLTLFGILALCCSASVLHEVHSCFLAFIFALRLVSLPNEADIFRSVSFFSTSAVGYTVPVGLLALSVALVMSFNVADICFSNLAWSIRHFRQSAAP